MHRFGSLRVLTVATLAAGGALVAGPSSVHAASATLTCGAKNIVHSIAPGVGKTATASAASAGTVTVLQNTQTNLEVQSVAPASGWTDNVVVPSGIKVHVGFFGTPHTNQVRFDARLNPAGTKLTVITVSCT